MNIKIQKYDLFTLGFYAICAQSVFIRELLGLFSGTEFVISVLISSWLFWVGIGGAIGGRLFRGIYRKRIRAFQGLVIAAALMFPVTILAIRLGRGVLVRSPGEMPPFFKSLVFCVFVMAPSAFTNGLIYNAASRWWGEKTGTLSTGVAWVYILEALGSVVGGLLFSLILLKFFTQFEISLIVSFFVMFVILRPFRNGHSYRIIFLIFLGLVFILTSNKLDSYSINELFHGFNVKGFGSSKYGEIAAIENNETVSFFSGGTRLFTIPDVQDVEEVVHIPLLAHNNPKRILLVGGGLAGEINEICKHGSVEWIDCVQLDDHLIKMVEEVEGKNNLDIDELIRSGRVKFIIGDGRLFLKETKKKYDIIIVNIPDPLNLELNRYYTEDFFRIAKSSLNSGGIFSISHSSSENFISDVQSRVLRSIKNSLEVVFDSVTVFPGSIVHFIAGKSKISVGSLLENLDERDLDTRFISRDFLPFRFSEERMEFIVSNIRDAKNVDINRDVLPVLTVYELFLEFSRKGFSFSKWIDIFSGNRKWIPVLVGAMIIVLIFLIPGKETAAKLDVWGVGLASFLFQINVLLAYQSFLGYLYNGIVFLTAFFMAGISLGTWSGYKRAFRLAKNPKLIHAAFILFSVFYILWLFVIGKINIGIIACSTGFSAASFIGGFFTGMFYRVVVSSVLDRLNNQEPAIFYAWDMFGACVGGLLGGIFIYPFSGSIGTIYLFVFIHLSSVLLLTGRWGKAYLPRK
ncbi:hypothetical protein J7M07_03240 [bacterium]|nr:hypothetical protein [bacterium]